MTRWDRNVLLHHERELKESADKVTHVSEALQRKENEFDCLEKKYYSLEANYKVCKAPFFSVFVSS